MSVVAVLLLLVQVRSTVLLLYKMTECLVEESTFRSPSDPMTWTSPHTQRTSFGCNKAIIISVPLQQKSGVRARTQIRSSHGWQ